MRSRALSLIVVVALAGCGSVDDDTLPPPALPRPGADAARPAPVGVVVHVGATLPLAAPVLALGRGRELAVLDGRRRVVELYDARSGKRSATAHAGVGPTRAATDGVELVYVVDTEGDAVLVFHTRPRLELVRRVYVPGSPYGIAFDSARRRLWVTLTERDSVAELSAGSRPRPLRELPSVRDPLAVAVGPNGGAVWVSGRDGRLQRIDEP